MCCSPDYTPQIKTRFPLPHFFLPFFAQSSPANNDYMGAFDLGGSGSGKLQLDLYWNETKSIEDQGPGPQRTRRVGGTLSEAVEAWWTTVTGAACGSDGHTAACLHGRNCSS